MHVTHVEGTVKGTVSATLGRLTVIVGPNGSGKSRLINTMELALMGFASDVVGRAEMRKESDLVALAAGDDLTAKATLEDGRVSMWSTKKTKTGAKKADHVKAINAQFPVSDVRAALTGSVETARKWLLQRVSSGVARKDVTTHLTSDSAERYEKKAKQMSSQDEVSILVTILEGEKSSIRSKKSEMTSLETSLSLLTGSLGVDPTEAQLMVVKQEAEAALKNYREVIAQHAQRQGPDLDALRAQAEGLIATFNAALASLQEVQQVIPQVGPPLGEMDIKVAELRMKVSDLAHIQTEFGSTACLVCESPGPFDFAARRDFMTSANKAMLERKQVYDILAQRTVRHEEALKSAQDAIGRYNHAKELATEDTTFLPSVEEAEALMQRANDDLRKVEDAHEGHKRVRSLREQERTLKRDIRDAEELVEGLQEALGSLLRSAREEFVKKVQSFLPMEDAFDLVLNEGDKEVCRFGFTRDGNLHTALSGAEWARLTLALACAAAKPDKDSLLVFVPEERAFDPETLRAVMLALTNAPGQVVITTPVKPAGKLPKGWTLVETQHTVSN
jgi:energy-coupling factor transporter ATP-binding protein EcfA2